MKLDKMKFAYLVKFLATDGWYGSVEELDNLVNIEMPEHPQIKADPATIDALMKAIHDGQKIEAIKQYRTLTGYGLKEAKDAVEKVLTD